MLIHQYENNPQATVPIASPATSHRWRWPKKRPRILSGAMSANQENSAIVPRYYIRWCKDQRIINAASDISADRRLPGAATNGRENNSKPLSKNVARQNVLRSPIHSIRSGVLKRNRPANCGMARIRPMPSPIFGASNSKAR